MAKKIDETLIIKHYNNGLSIAEINRLGLASGSTISKILKRNNISIRKTNGRSLNLPKNEINKLYNDGKSTYEIAKMFGCSGETIRKRIKNKRSYREVNLIRSDEIKTKISKSCKNKWQDEEYVNKVKKATSTKEYKEKLSKAAIKNYSISLGAYITTNEAKLVISKDVKKRWKDKDYYDKQLPHFNWRAKKASDASVEALKNPEARSNWIEKLRKIAAKSISSKPKISTQQKQLYYLLNRANVEYIQEGEDTAISDFYVVDCIIPKRPKDIIIEVQGEYWHSLDHVIIKDKQKKTYIERHTNYDLLYLNELDFKSFFTLKRKLQYVGIKLVETCCTVKDLTINRITEKDAKLFFETFHYSSSIRLGATTYGAFLNNQLMAAISYTPPIRTQVARSLGVSLKEVKEISRLAIATDLICKNTASWFIANTVKLLPNNIRMIVSYSDETYGHVGTVYKASNFICDKIIDNTDFHYINEFKEKFHKKTIWDRSKRLKLTMEEYAEKHNLHKIISNNIKRRWIYKRT